MSGARREIFRLMNEYCFSMDRGDMDAFAGLFEHATFLVEGDPEGPMVGREGVAGMCRKVTLYDGLPRTKHVMTNVQIEVDEAGAAATAQSYLTVFQALPPDFPLQAIFSGHYHDVFEKAGDRWRFKSRTISPDLVGDLSRHRADMA